MASPLRLFALSLPFAFHALSTAAPLLDGDFSDWNAADVVAEDPAGDAAAAFDVTRLAAQTDGTSLYLRLALRDSLNIQNGAEQDGKLLMRISPVDREQTLEIDFRGRSATLTDGAPRPIEWPVISFTSMPTFASAEYEMRIDLTPLAVAAGDAVTVGFSGSDELDEPATILLEGPGRPADAAPMAIPAKSGDLRVCCLNTLGQGLADPDRAAALRRLCAVTDGDVFCFQEEWEEAPFRNGCPNALRGENLNLLWANGAGIATTLPLRRVPMDDFRRGCPGVVTLPSGERVIVLSVHFACCGYVGSEEDKTRIRQARELASQVKRLREGAYGEEFRGLSAVVIGDYNLVGSRDPLTILEEDAGLTEQPLPRCGDGSAVTWRAMKGEDFWPGRLDLVTYDARGLKPTGGVVIDSAQLTPADRQRLGLEAADSEVSDHLMLVTDFEVIR